MAVGRVLTLRAPPGSRFVPGKGADSLVGTIEGPGFTLGIDYGVYSDPLTSTGSYGNVQAADTRIDGKPARTLSATLINPANGEGYFFGLHVTNIAPSAVGSLKLTLTATLRRREQVELIKRIVQTIRFKSLG